MRKLLSANFVRLWKSPLFWLGLAVSFAFPAAVILGTCWRAVKNPDVIYALDRYYFQVLPFMGLILTIFISMFLGTEYSDGTIRNKLIVGHDRASVYLANWLTSCGAALLFLLASFIGPLVGVPKLGFFQIHTEAAYWLVSYTEAILLTVAMTAIFTLVSMNIANKASAVVAAVFLFFCMLMGASALYSALCEPEMVSGMILTVDGVQMGEATPNPLYVGGAMRSFYELLMDILPTGQAILLTDEGPLRPLRQMICSVLLTGVSVCGGVVLFRKKNLK